MILLFIYVSGMTLGDKNIRLPYFCLIVRPNYYSLYSRTDFHSVYTRAFAAENLKPFTYQWLAFITNKAGVESSVYVHITEDIFSV